MHPYLWCNTVFNRNESRLFLSDIHNSYFIMINRNFSRIIFRINPVISYHESLQYSAPLINFANYYEPLTFFQKVCFNQILSIAILSAASKNLKREARQSSWQTSPNPKSLDFKPFLYAFTKSSNIPMALFLNSCLCHNKSLSYYFSLKIFRIALFFQISIHADLGILWRFVIMEIAALPAS